MNIERKELIIKLDPSTKLVVPPARYKVIKRDSHNVVCTGQASKEMDKFCSLTNQFEIDRKSQLW